MNKNPDGFLMMNVAVVIPVFARSDVFATIGFLRAQDYANRLMFVVVDNGNAPELSARLFALAGADCHVIRFSENRGGSAAYIAGMDYVLRMYAEVSYVWLLDDDAVPNAKTLPSLVGEMERLLAADGKAASVGSAVLSGKTPGLLVECGARFCPILGHAFPRLKGRKLETVGERTLRVDYAAACSLLVNTKAVRACGFWEDVFIHFDDIEWGLRVTRAGWHNYATTASTVVHPEFDPEKAGPWICYFDSRNQLWLASRFGLLHVLFARIKDALKNLRAELTGRHVDRIAYRKLALRDYKSGIRRTKAELERIVTVGRTSV